MILPVGYVTILEAAETLLPAMYAGVPDLPIVTSLRQEGIDVRDGPAMDRAVVELWKAVDEGSLRPMAIGGRPRRVERLDAAITKQIPTLRNPRGRGFTFLRQSNPTYHQLASCFGSDLPRATLAFRETEVHKLARKLIRVRRIASRADGTKKPRGRPSRQGIISTVLEIVESGKFSPLNGVKAVTQLVNRKGKFEPPVSDDTLLAYSTAFTKKQMTGVFSAFVVGGNKSHPGGLRPGSGRGVAVPGARVRGAVRAWRPDYRV